MQCTQYFSYCFGVFITAVNVTPAAGFFVFLSFFQPHRWHLLFFRAPRSMSTVASVIGLGTWDWMCGLISSSPKYRRKSLLLPNWDRFRSSTHTHLSHTSQGGCKIRLCAIFCRWISPCTSTPFGRPYQLHLWSHFRDFSFSLFINCWLSVQGAQKQDTVIFLAFVTEGTCLIFEVESEVGRINTGLVQICRFFICWGTSRQFFLKVPNKVMPLERSERASKR